ncbi:MAG: alpha/beta hydrolase family protein [Hyphomicrobium sp.]
MTALSIAMLGLAAHCDGSLRAEPQNRASLYGPFGPEGLRLREQLWILPGGDAAIPLRATVFRPEDSSGVENSEDAPRRPLVVINHGTLDDGRISVAMPVYYWLSRWFVDRGYVVVLPQRRGHGATGGDLVESVGTCAAPDHAASGNIAADDIEAAVDYMTQQPFIEPSRTIVVGISTGGWASLALAARSPANVRAVINFAGGRGGYAGGDANAVCGERGLIEAAAAFGAATKIPTLWLYAANDSYFGPDLARAMADAWGGAGGRAALHILPTYGDDGHAIVDDRAGRDVWGPWVEKFLEAKGAPEIASGDKINSDGLTAVAAPVALKNSSDPPNGDERR